MSINAFELFATLGLDASEFEKGLKNAEAMGKNLGSAMQKAGTVIAGAMAGATAGVVAFAGSSVNAGKDFDSAMSQVAATMGKTVDEIENLRDFAKQMGSTTAFSATQSAEALNYMALAGYDAETSMSMLPNVLNLASAGGMNLARASDMVTDAQSALGLTLEQTTEMVDIMAKTSSSTNTSVEQLGDAFLTVGGLAKNLSGDTEELAQVLGILADNGIKGSEGGTHLRNAILKLSAPTKEGAKALKELGVEAFEADGSMRAMSDIFLDLKASMEGLGDDEKTQYITDIFNVADVAAVNALLDTTADRWDEVAEKITDAQGSAEAMAETQLDNLAGDMTLFQSALEGVQIAISDELTPTIREFVQFGSDALSQMTTAIQEDGISGIVDVGGDIISNLLSGVLDKLPIVADAVGEIVVKLADAIITNIPKLAEPVIQIVDKLGEFLVDALPSLMNSATQIILVLANGISKTLPSLIPSVVDAVVLMAETLIDNLDLIIEAGLEIVLGLVDGVVTAIPRLVAKIPDLITAILNALEKSYPLIFEAGIELLMALTDAIPDIITSLTEALPKIITSIIDFFANNVGLIIECGITLFGALIEAIPPTVISLVEAVPQIITSIVDTLMNYDWLGVGKNIMGGIASGFTNGVNNFVEGAKSAGNDILDNVKDMFGIHSPSTVFRDQVGKFLAEGLGEGFTDKMDDVKLSMMKSLPTEFDTDITYKGSIMQSENAVIGGYGNITINVNGIQYQNIDELTKAISSEIMNVMNRKKAGYGT